ncbi:MAG: zinc-binding dehydrogenase [Aurantimonas endophytica]|uniref:NADPH:quinone reductase-like Zn-dependent oxidoreductase n=1 Tax=Aurantimonas endophytica TaxID=1522175 RepID=A0A7W6MMX9_9HYPH|nr:zinc-binding dehydrogenase [Aurantimonas endophytica]MBB4001307.1 NADPH:quinone reductase-like Zn-dependent oxidoreductase [Aurantimonas endophytica]MCO6403050.1 zinc-binding dehydrogenase [Aurantimonas endophytica]
MRAVIVSKAGAGSRLVLAERPAPEADANEALVRVRAISLNNGEVRGALNGAADGDRPGWDLAGVIEAAPEDSVFRAGDRVVGLVWSGAWAERVAVPLDRLAKIPDEVSFAAAATLPVAGLTAAIALRKKPIGPGSRVLVTAATGGVGVYAIQLAAATGAHVTAFTRDVSQTDFLRGLGASAVAVGVEAAQAAEPFDLILEGVAGALLGEALMWLAPRGVCVLFGDASEDKLTTFDASRFRLGSGGAFGGTVLYGFFLIEELTRSDRLASASDLLADLAGRLASGSLRPVIGWTGPWHDVDTTAKALLRREFVGKAVLLLDDQS